MSAPDDKMTHKGHQKRKSGRSAEKKKAKKTKEEFLNDKQKNPKAFTFNSAIRAERMFRRKQDIDTKKQHIPVIDRTPIEPPPVLVAVVGPPKVGKTLLIQCLIKSFVRQPLSTIVGPITVVSGKKRRITFIECNNDINSMIDIAKVADLVLLLVDASFGFEMEIFEFLNICQVHGMPRIMGVLTHLDLIKNAKQLKQTKKLLKHRFWTEVYAGAKLFYLSGMIYDEYLRNEVKNLSRFISVMKFRPLIWRSSHPYFLVDRVEDVTPPETIRKNSKVDRTVILYGYVRGVPLSGESSVHVSGVGDFRIKGINFLPDPCPLPDQLKKRALSEKERLIYAPFSGVGGIVYDKDAVYVELGGSHSHKEEDTGLATKIFNKQETNDEKWDKIEMPVFKGASGLQWTDVVDGDRTRRKVVFDDAEEEGKIKENGGNDKEEEDSERESESDEEYDDNDAGEGEEIEEEEEEQDEEEEEDEEEELEDDDEAPPLKRKKTKTESTTVSTPVAKKQKVYDDNDVAGKLEAELAALKAETTQEVSKKSKTKDNETYKVLTKNKDNELKNKITETLSRLEEKSSKIKSKNDSDDESSYDEDSDDEDFYDSEEENNADDSKMEEDDEEEEEEEDDDESELDEDIELKWKTDLAQKAKEAFINRQRNNVNLQKLVYGIAENKKKSEDAADLDDNDDDNSEEIGGIFKMVNEEQKRKLEDRELKNLEDCIFFSREPPRDWTTEENKLSLVNRFVTGKWADNVDAETLLKLNNMQDDDEEVMGDFEDLETGEKFQAPEAPKELPKEEADERKALLEKKRKLKQQFDSEYDGSESKNHYEELKQEVEKQAQLNKTEFDGFDDDVRVQLEGYRPGMYVRVEIDSVPCELITNFDPTYPLIVGGLLHGEENIGFVQTRLKKHRWYGKILKTKDPLIISVGWRRFQTLPIYAKLEDNMRHRMLKYTPEHVACMAHFWGPITPQGTGVLAVQDVATRIPGFRIAATGTITELDKSTCIVKKLKLTGVPVKIQKKTAFIKDMFNSQLEVAKFEGAKIKTVSGIRGQIKKSARLPSKQGKSNQMIPGCFRATFEDKIQLSDIVFCRTWFKVDVPKFYNPVNSLLLPQEMKTQWKGMKLTGQLKKELNIKAEANKDSSYTPIVRETKVFKDFSIPRKLQESLPYRDKPKLQADPAKRRVRFANKRVAVVRDAKEEKVANMLKMIRTSYSAKVQKLKEATNKRMTDYQNKLRAAEIEKSNRDRTKKKELYRELSKKAEKDKKKGRN